LRAIPLAGRSAAPCRGFRCLAIERCVEVSQRSVPIEEVTTGLAEDDDLALIRRAAVQDRQAFEALYRRYAPVTASGAPAIRLVDACAALARIVGGDAACD
jgi:hypothetical protein